MVPIRWIVFVLSLGLLCVPAFSQEQAVPGAVNYVEGAASLEGRHLSRKDIGNTTMQPGEVLHTGQGRAEVLLTPGVFLRVGNQSAVKMISPDIVQTQVEVVHGKAGVEVDEIHEQNDLEVIDGGVTTRLLKRGFYEFTAGHPEVLVFSGEAEVELADGRHVKVKGHHDFVFDDGAQLKPAGFNQHDAEDGLFKWSSLRSQYLAEANNELASQYAGANGFYPGWYWDPYGWDYTFIGMNSFYSPFGWGYYPPWYAGYGGGGYYGDYDGDGYYGGGGYGVGLRGYRGAYNGRQSVNGLRGGNLPGRGSLPGNNGFQGGMNGGRGGSFGGGNLGFHGGGGGSFHGGGGGSFHGGGGGMHR